MLLANLLKTSTFRLAVIYLALFVTSVIALLGYIYWNTAGFLARQTDQAVEAEIQGLAEQYSQGGLPLLVHTVIQRSRDPRQSLYLVLDARGNVLAGNLDSKPTALQDAEGYVEFSYQRRTMEGVERHAARARYIELPEGFFLLVGRDVEELRNIERLITTSLVWAVALTLALGLVGGLVMSRNMLARLDDINRTSREIMRGDLGQRIPVSGTGDELDQLASNLNNMLEQIEALMMGMREVTDNVAHDLRSPLNRLRNRLEVTLMKSASEEDYRVVLQRTIEEADYLLTTFNALLSIARAEAGSARDGMADVNLSALVQDVAELYEPVAEEAGQALHAEVEEGLRLFANREVLSQAIANLIDNAIKHGRSTEEGAVTVSAARTQNRIMLTVADNGPGIPESDRSRVLERFVRLETSRNTPGSGLGLSLAAAAARLHGGRIALSDNKPGLCVTLSLPV
ncbi:ATP-binding protein [Tepidicaulis sp. LMO-SS28]|uniref:sensor histidine kinase n=1 Tax=Tepidicaulis sp. LMO-SS28 TaxID=3447455 RepID=UPI003EE376A6